MKNLISISELQNKEILQMVKIARKFKKNDNSSNIRASYKIKNKKVGSFGDIFFSSERS